MIRAWPTIVAWLVVIAVFVIAASLDYDPVTKGYL
jgi:hypothetical protein